MKKYRALWDSTGPSGCQASFAGIDRRRNGQRTGFGLVAGRSGLSLPNMLVILSVLGTRKTMVFVSPVAVMSTMSGLIFGTFF